MRVTRNRTKAEAKLKKGKMASTAGSLLGGCNGHTKVHKALNHCRFQSERTGGTDLDRRSTTTGSVAKLV